MVDEDKKEDIQEEQEEIIVDLPKEESEGEVETKPEEQPEQEAPVPSEEVVEEESEDEEPSEEEEDTESSEDEEESKDKKQFGKRAEKRIKRLVKEKKDLEAQLQAMKDQEESWTSERETLQTRTKDSELQAINSYIERLKAQEKQSLTALKTAKEAGDIDSEIKAQDALASVKAETLIAQQYKVRAESDTSKKETPKSKPKKEQKPAQDYTPDRKALGWQKRNEWFGGSSTKDRIMTQAAMVIHKELVDEGIVPSSNADEYYNELDSRIRGEFPERFKNTAAKKVPPVLSGTRSAIGKNQVKLTKSEVEMANRLGVSLQEYARQKVRQQAGG
jgi:hypothetical protein